MSAQRRKFTDEFRQEAVALVQRSGQSRQSGGKGVGHQPDGVKPVAAGGPPTCREPKRIPGRE